MRQKTSEALRAESWRRRGGSFKKVADPSPAEIQRAAREISESWDDATRRRRRGGAYPVGPWEFSVISVREVFPDSE